jgi:hypothetical protein
MATFQRRNRDSAAMAIRGPIQILMSLFGRSSAPLRLSCLAKWMWCFALSGILTTICVILLLVARACSDLPRCLQDFCEEARGGGAVDSLKGNTLHLQYVFLKPKASKSAGEGHTGIEWYASLRSSFVINLPLCIYIRASFIPSIRKVKQAT